MGDTNRGVVRHTQRRQRRRRCTGRQAAGELLGNRLGFGSRDVTDDGNHRARGRIVGLVKRLDIGTVDRPHALRRSTGAVGMGAVHGACKCLAGDRLGLGFGLFQAGDGARLLAIDRLFGKARALQQSRQQVKRGVALGTRRQATQGDTGAILVGARTTLGAGVGELLGDLVLAQAGTAQCQHAIGQAGQPCLAGRRTAPAGIEIDRDIEHRDRPTLDKHDLGAGFGGPRLDRQIGPGRRLGQQEECRRQQTQACRQAPGRKSSVHVCDPFH